MGRTVITNNNYYPNPAPPKIIVNGLEFNSDGTYINTKYKGLDMLVFYNGQRYLTRKEYTVLLQGGVTIYLKGVFTDQDTFILIPNKSLSAVQSI